MLKDKLKTYKNFLLEINNFAFQVFLISYLLFLVIDYLKEGFITDFFNLNILLSICVVTGIILVIFKKDKTVQKSSTVREKLEKNDYIFIIVLAVIGTFLVFLKIKEIGWPGYIFSIMIGILIYLVSVLLLRDKS